jgi:hypothetical protein
MSGHLYYDPTTDDFCKPMDSIDILFSNEVSALADDSKQLGTGQIVTPFMVATRGGCSFVTKVRNMEEAGIAVSIVIDDNGAEDVTDIVMSDDGSGSGIRIPSMLISKTDGDKLLDFLKTATQPELDQVHILASFDMYRPDNRVEYDIWYSSSNDLALDFIQSFMKIDKRFGDRVLMTPRFVFWECLEDCEEDFVNKHCFGAGKYCAQDSGKQSSFLTGQEIVLEDLRQMCIYKRAYWEIG